HPAASSESDQRAAAAPDLTSSSSPLYALDRLWIRLGLQFDDRSTERNFLRYYGDRYYGFGHTLSGIAIGMWMIYGTVLLMSDNGAMGPTRFHYMVGAPILILFFVFGFSQFAKRHWQIALSIFGLVAVLMVFATVNQMKAEAWFRPEHT